MNCFRFLMFIQVLQLLVGSNINKDQLSHIADRTLLECNGDQVNDGTISYEAFKQVIQFKVNDCENGFLNKLWFLKLVYEFDKGRKFNKPK